MGQVKVARHYCLDIVGGDFLFLGAQAGRGLRAGFFGTAEAVPFHETRALESLRLSLRLRRGLRQSRPVP